MRERRWMKEAQENSLLEVWCSGEGSSVETGSWSCFYFFPLTGLGVTTVRYNRAARDESGKKWVEA